MLYMLRMRSVSVLLLLASSSFLVSKQAFAISADAGARVVAPVSINKVADMRFGQLSPGSEESMVTLIENDIARPTGNAILIPNTGAQSPVFELVGDPNTTVAVSVYPETGTLVSSSSSMFFDAVLTSPIMQLGSNGKKTFSPNGVINIGINQAPGTYVGTYVVTAIYQ